MLTARLLRLPHHRSQIVLLLRFLAVLRQVLVAPRLPRHFLLLPRQVPQAKVPARQAHCQILVFQALRLRLAHFPVRLPAFHLAHHLRLFPRLPHLPLAVLAVILSVQVLPVRYPFLVLVPAFPAHHQAQILTGFGRMRVKRQHPFGSTRINQLCNYGQYTSKIIVRRE